jgi:tetratricopeptide (TPR) repeat protein
VSIRLVESILDSWEWCLARLTHTEVRPVAETGQFESLYLRAWRLMRAGENEQAMALLARVTQSAPGFADALEAYGELLDMTGKQELATSMYDAERELRLGTRCVAPDRPYPQRRVGRFTQEIAAYSVVSRYMSNGSFPYVALGNAFLMRGMPERAILHYDVALAFKPGDSEVTMLKAEALSMMGRYHDALPLYELALAKNPGNAGALGGRAIAYLALGDVAKADADWHRQLALLSPERAAARACVALRLGEHALALAELDYAIEKEPKDPYWQVFRLSARTRLEKSIDIDDAAVSEEWPARLVALYAGHMSTAAILKAAACPEQRVEALYHSAVVALSHDPGNARLLLQQTLDEAPPTSIEYCAARHELARLAT